MWTRQELKSRAKVAYKANYWPCVLAGFLLALADGSISASFSSNSSYQSAQQLSGASSIEDMLEGSSASGGLFGFAPMLAAFSVTLILIIAVAGILIDIFIMGPLEVGTNRFFLVNALQKAELSEIGVPYSRQYAKTVKTMFLRTLYILLWTLLLIVPGIIKSYQYRLVPYILAEKPDIETREALELSKAMMEGHKWNAFVLDLSFLGWAILGALTFGIVNLLITQPYMGATNAELYLTLRTQS